MSAHQRLADRLKKHGHLEKFEILSSDAAQLIAEWDDLLDLYEDALGDDETPPWQDTLDIGTITK